MQHPRIWDAINRLTTALPVESVGKGNSDPAKYADWAGLEDRPNLRPELLPSYPGYLHLRLYVSDGRSVVFFRGLGLDLVADLHGAVQLSGLVYM